MERGRAGACGCCNALVLYQPVLWRELRLLGRETPMVALQTNGLRSESLADWGTAQAMVALVVKRFAPERVIVFGSLARGDAGPDSDIDILIVMPVVDGGRRETAVAILQALASFDTPKDVVVVTPEEFAASRDLVGTVVYPAVREGRELHAA